jgi:hypothetical protein
MERWTDRRECGRRDPSHRFAVTCRIDRGLGRFGVKPSTYLYGWSFWGGLAEKRPNHAALRPSTGRDGTPPYPTETGKWSTSFSASDAVHCTYATQSAITPLSASKLSIRTGAPPPLRPRNGRRVSPPPP